jgi:hypothetical protein
VNLPGASIKIQAQTSSWKEAVSVFFNNPEYKPLEKPWDKL